MQAERTPGWSGDLHAVRKLHAFAPMTGHDRETLSRLMAHRTRVEPHEDILVEGVPSRDIFLLTSGWAIRYKLLSDGRRQIVGHLIPGDFFGLRASMFQIADDSVQALTTTSIVRIPGKSFSAMLRDRSNLGMAIMWSVMREHSILAEHAVRLGRRSARERIAHLLIELLHRLQLVRLAGDNEFHLPLTQEVLADTLGLSIVHVNRALRRLRNDGTIALDPQRRRVVINDVGRLGRIAEFSAGYLDQGPALGGAAD